MMPVAQDFGRQYLQARIAAEFALAEHIGVVVERASATELVLRAPLTPNANDKGTAFGGSLFALAVLTGWAWIARDLAARGCSADVVIQTSSIRYLAPVHGEFRAVLQAPAGTDIEKFIKMLQRARRGRIDLAVDIYQDTTLATHFDGIYAAIARDA